MRVLQLRQELITSLSNYSVKILGVVLDRHLTFNMHVQNICKSVNYHIRALKHIRTSLTTDMARTVACALVNLATGLRQRCAVQHVGVERC